MENSDIERDIELREHRTIIHGYEPVWCNGKGDGLETERLSSGPPLSMKDAWVTGPITLS